MPLMISKHRTLYVQSSGHSYRFPKGEEVYVTRSAASDCYRAGVEMVDAKDKPPVDPITEEGIDLSTAMTVTERTEKLLAAVNHVLTTNNPLEFTASNTPKLAVVAGYAGFTVSAGELKKVLADLQRAEQESKEQ